jgi:hypothetical protein
MDKNKIVFIIAHKYIKGYISYTEHYINNINKFYENALIIVVDNNSISKDDIFDDLKKYENVVLLDNNIESKFELGAYTVGLRYLIDNNLYKDYDYITMTQDTFIIKNRYDFNELHKRNVTACPLVGCKIDTNNKTFTGVQFDHMDYYVPLMESIGLSGRWHEMSFCWCTSFVIKSTKINDLLHYLNQIVIKERWQSCAGERYMARILLELNDGENYSLDCDLREVASKYDCHSVDLFSDLPVFFAKRSQAKNTGPIC